MTRIATDRIRRTIEARQSKKDGAGEFESIGMDARSIWAPWTAARVEVSAAVL